MSKVWFGSMFSEIINFCAFSWVICTYVWTKLVLYKYYWSETCFKRLSTSISTMHFPLSRLQQLLLVITSLEVKPKFPGFFANTYKLITKINFSLWQSGTDTRGLRPSTGILKTFHSWKKEISLLQNPHLFAFT